MTRPEIRDFYNSHFARHGEKIFDVDTDNESYARIFTVTKNHTIYRRDFLIIDESLDYIRTKLLW